MHAVLLHDHGGFEQLEFREDVPRPAPAAHEVLIRVGAAGVNNTDINTRIGWYTQTATDSPSTAAASLNGSQQTAWTGAPLCFPLIQGADACGYIVAVGTDIDSSRIGQRVLIDPVLRSSTGSAVGYLGSERNGTFAQFLTVPSANACPIVSALSDAELASFPCSYLAAENMLTRAAVNADDTVLVTGASGGVGSAVVQLASRRGARVIAIAATGKAEVVKSLGASAVLPRDSDWLTHLGRNSVDVAIDVVGGPRFGELLHALRAGGRCAIAGAIAGATVQLDLRPLYLKDLRILGCTVPEPGLFTRLIGYVERGEIRPLVSRNYPLQAIVAAQQDFLSKRYPGKLVLIP